MTAVRTITRRRSVGANLTALLGSQLTTFALAGIVTVVLPRALGPEGLGQLRIATSLWAVAAVFVAFGTPLLLVKELASEDGFRGAVVGDALLAQGMLLAVGVVIMAGYVFLAGYDGHTASVVAITGVGAALYVVVNTARAALQGLERMEYTAAADVSGKIGYVGALLLLLWLGGDERAAAAAGAVQASAAIAVVYPVLRRFPGLELRGRVAAVRPLLRRSRPYLAIVSILVVYQQIDVIVISWIADTPTVGWYATADGLVSAMYFIPVIAVSALLPHLSRIHRVDPSATLPVLRRAFGYLTAVAVPVGLGTMTVGHDIAVQLFGASFAQAGPVLVVLGVVLILTHLTILLGQYAIAVDRQALWTRLMVVVTVATIGLDAVLVPLTDRTHGNGAIGGALAYIATEGFLLVFGIVALAPRLFDATLVRKLLKSAVAGAAMVAAVWPLRGGPVALAIAIGGAVYGLGLGATRFLDHGEITAAVRMARAALRRGERAGGPAPAVEEDSHA